MNSKRVLITGGTGYIGTRLLKVLENKGFEISCLARKPEYLQSKVLLSTNVYKGDLLKPETLAQVFERIDTAFYLVHSMGDKESFEEREKDCARNFADAAKKARVRTIVYLGGLGDSSKELSSHLQSRHKTGEILRSSGVQVIEFRSSVVIGSGSLSFEMIRALVERLPLMTTPKWVRVKTQPIAISDLLQYLIAGMELDLKENKIFEIGSGDIMTYGDLMREYAKQRGLKRLIIPVPVLTPWLSSLWLGLVTPVYARVGRKLVDSLKHTTVIKNNCADKYFNIKPLSVRDAITKALHDEDNEFYLNRWSDSLSSGNTYKTFAGTKFGSRIVDSRTVEIKAPINKVFPLIKKIGGKNGWYYANWLWRIRAYIDLLFGGIGIRRGRTHPEEIRVGDVIDWWRVEEYKDNRYLRLFAEMKVPGRAWLEFEVEGENGKSVIKQTATFDPLGLTGILYWYFLYPIHALIFQGMLKEIGKKAQS